ncbi:DEAD/DEAH box helicase [Alloscardovia criceti]|uniref:DEAD/DEAH box helicase n=1 Tax=Alloscardovia criceti TaxID=356828 RepID=UPI00037E12C1|nr:DEAD/DEAH box helicase [Alloscardovia criceti]
MSQNELSPAQRYAAFKERQRQEKTATGIFASSLPFELDDFQKDACEALEHNHNVLVAAPTGAGKTVVADFAIFLAQQKNVKAFYTTPIKALSNQKFHELVALYGEDRVGLLTGDVSINSEADIVVMTTEVLRNMLYENSTTLTALRYVILDEVHYLADRIRGQVWEEVIIHLPQYVKIIGLSATVSNVEDFTAWIRSVRGDTTLVMSEHRPVPLHQHVMLQQGPRKEPEVYDLYQEGTDEINRSLVHALDHIDILARKAAQNANRYKFEHAKHTKHSKHGKKPSKPQAQQIRHYTPKRWAVIDELDYLDMLPGIYFIFSRNGCDKAVAQCLQAGLDLTTDDEVRRIRAIVNDMIDGQLTKDEMKALHFNQFVAALELGFASHHAGMVTLFRHIVEALFEQGLIKVVFATETLALGINMPARTVIVEKLEKFNGVGHVNLTPGEFTQLTGRAGRRGIDTVGHAVVVDHQGFVPAAAASLASKRVYPLHSSFTPNFNMAVNLLHTHTLEESRHTLDLSFAQWEANKSADSLSGMVDDTSKIVRDYESAMHCNQGNFVDFMRIRMEISDIEKKDRRILKKKVFTSEKARRKAFSALDKRLSVLKSREQNHPCKTCPDFSEHVRWGHRWARQVRELERLENRLASRTQSVSRHFDRICSVLRELDYVEAHDNSTDLVLTERGQLLRQIYSENDLLLAQCVLAGLFDTLSDQDCAAIITAFVYESRYGSTQEPAHYPGGSKGVLATTVAQIKAIDKSLRFTYDSYDLEHERELDFGLVEIMFNWVSEKPLSEVLKFNELTAGDFVRTCKRSTDVLNQLMTIGKLRGDKHLVGIAGRAFDLVNHGIVALNPLE